LKILLSLVDEGNETKQIKGFIGLVQEEFAFLKRILETTTSVYQIRRQVFLFDSAESHIVQGNK